MAQWMKNVDANKYKAGAFCEHGDEMGLVCAECDRKVPRPPNANANHYRVQIRYRLLTRTIWVDASPHSIDGPGYTLNEARAWAKQLTRSRIVTQLRDGRKLVI